MNRQIVRLANVHFDNNPGREAVIDVQLEKLELFDDRTFAEPERFTIDPSTDINEALQRIQDKLVSSGHEWLPASDVEIIKATAQHRFTPEVREAFARVEEERRQQNLRLLGAEAPLPAES